MEHHNFLKVIIDNSGLFGSQYWFLYSILFR